MIDFHHQFLCAIQLQPTIFFRKVHRLIRVKVRLDHSHTTGKILGYAHDFCNWSVHGNKIEIPMIMHNLFGFDMFFFRKGYCPTV